MAGAATPASDRRKSSCEQSERISAGDVRSLNYRPAMQRLRHLTELECYTRIYGDRDDTVRVIGSKARDTSRFPTLNGDTLRELFEDRLDERDPDTPAEAA